MRGATHTRTQVSVDSVESVLEVLQIGTARRTTASTLMNDVSSRSHAICTIHVESTPRSTGWLLLLPHNRRYSTLFTHTLATRGAGDDIAIDSDAPIPAGRIVSKVTFVDLAGSERLKRTGVTTTANHSRHTPK